MPVDILLLEEKQIILVEMLAFHCFSSVFLFLGRLSVDNYTANLSVIPLGDLMPKNKKTKTAKYTVFS